MIVFGRKQTRISPVLGMAGFALTLGLSGACAAEEVAPFVLTGIEGNVAMRYLLNKETIGSGAPSTIYSSLQEEVFINTHSYLYHPNFLKMDLGGGPVFVQNHAESGALEQDERERLYNLSARLSFLENKAYPFVVYYDHLNPTVATSLTQSFILNNTKYGANFTLREPVSPVMVYVEAFHQQSEGVSPSWVTNDAIDQFATRLYTALGPSGYAELEYQTNQQETSSGYVNLPIVPTTIDSHTASFRSRTQSGDKRQYTFTNFIGMNSLAYVQTNDSLNIRDFRFNPDLSWQHSEALTSFYRYNLMKRYDDINDTTTQTGYIGLVHNYQNSVYTTFDVHGDSSHTTGVDLRSYGTGLTVTSQQPVAIGSLQLSAGLLYNQFNREASAALVAEINEQHPVTGSIPVTLNREFIVASSIVVRSANRQQLYTLADYRILVNGSRTQIQWLLPDQAPPGISVDYDYQTGGSVDFNVFDQNYQLSLTVARYYTGYLRHREVSYQVTAGSPTLPFNPLRNNLFGVRVDQPVWQDVSLGGEAIMERQYEEISPYQRSSLDFYIQTLLPARSSLRLSWRHQLIEYEYSIEDVDLTATTAQLRTSPWPQTLVTLETNREEDSGGTLPRQTWRHNLIAEWRYRQFQLRAEGQYARETLGDYERTWSVIRALVQRNF
jgi:hypothetical protein